MGTKRQRDFHCSWPQLKTQDFEASSELHIKCSGTEQLRGAAEISFVFRAGLEVHLGSARLRAAT